MLRKVQLAIAFLISAAAFAQNYAVSGRVCDLNGTPIPSALVESGAQTTRTNSNGEFRIELHSVPAKVQIKAAGFAPKQFTYRTADPPREWRLTVAVVEQRVTVSADESSRNVTAFSAKDLTTNGAFSLDEVFRAVPGFTLFRRTPSWSANPTTQGVSLRGSGASGASRALIMLDGVPLNDPFGGWVYWGRVPPDTLDGARVIEGGTSEVYGTAAMGGAIELSRTPATESHLTGTGYLGNLFTPGGSAIADQQLGRWWLGGGVSGLRTNGYIPVAPSERGAVDTVANSEYGTGWMRIDRDLSSATRVFLGGNLYAEDRRNGTYLQKNSATIRELRGGTDWIRNTFGSVSTRVYGGTENLTQTFSAIAPDRLRESLTRSQSVPVSQWGLSALWSRNLGAKHYALAGLDAGWVQGDSEELGYSGGLSASKLLSGGTQWRVAGYVEDHVRLDSRSSFSAGVRWDHWANTAGRTVTVPLDPSGSASRTDFADRSEDFISPSVGLDYRVSSRARLYASGYRSFRAPTINELYRGFRVGNVVTLANAALTSEQQIGAEAGGEIHIAEGQTVRVAYFWSGISDPIGNVTLSITPTLVTRQRENLGGLRSAGAEISWKARWSPMISTVAAYEYANAVVSSFTADPTLVGNRIPQVPRNTASAQVQLTKPEAFNFTLRARYQGRQYDDDLNQFLLGGYLVTDAYFSRDLRKNLLVFIGVENLLDRRYEVGRTPATTIGPPVLGRVGVQWVLGRNAD